MQTCDVAVVGTGIAGAACAYELASSGLRVAVVEPNSGVSGATALAYGSLSLMHDAPGQFELTRHGLTLWKKYAGYLPEDCEYSASGSIRLAAGQSDMQDLLELGNFFKRQGANVEFLIGRALAEAEPDLRNELAGGLHVAEDGWLRAGRAAEFLLQLASRNGAQVVRQAATLIDEHEVRLADGSLLYAGNIVNAMGKDAGALTPGLPLDLSKGHVLVVETDATCAQHLLSTVSLEREPAAEATVRLEVHQGLPDSKGRSEIWIGSSWQPVTQQRAGDLVSTQVEPRIVALLLRRAIDLIPGIGRAKPLRSWTGLRTVTPDGLPIIGKLPGKDGIFAAVGLGGYGATAALAAAKLIADEILSRTPEIDPKPYRANRFEGRSSKHAEGN